MQLDRLQETRRRVRIALLTTTPLAVALLIGAGFQEAGRPEVTGGAGGGGAGFDAFESKITQNPTPSRSWSLDRLLPPRQTEPATRREMALPDEMVPNAGLPRESYAPSTPQPSPPGIVRDPAYVDQSTVVRDDPNQAERSIGDVQVRAQPVSTFSADVDTSSYSNARRTILAGGRPSGDQVRVEEMVNYFRYDLPTAPAAGVPFSITTDVVRSPWNSGRLVARVALAGREVARAKRPPANLVLLVDVSGSMASDDRLGLVQRSFARMVDRLGPRDKVSIVTYANGVGLRLAPTSDMAEVKAALGTLSSGGGTNGTDGLRLAYDQARAGRIAGGINRVMIATDGDFNVGTSDTESLKRLIERERRDGITLSTIGVGEGFNDAMMESIADAGNGNAVYLDDDLEAEKALGDELEGSINVIAKDVKAQVEFNPAVVSSYRFIGYRNRRLSERAFDDDAVDAGDIGSGHQVTALYEITPILRPGDVAARRRYEANRVRDGGDPTIVVPRAAEAFNVKVRYKLPDGTRSILLQQAVPTSAVSAVSNAPEATGDTAFALAVASFGQRLDGTLGGGFGTERILGLAGAQTDARRAEFIDMVRQFGPTLLGSMPMPPVSAASVTTSSPIITSPVPLPSSSLEQKDSLLRIVGWWLLALSGVLALALAFIDQRLRKMTTTADDASPTLWLNKEAMLAPHAAPIDRTAITSALKAARMETSEEGRRSVDAFEATMHRAITASVEEPEIADEVRAVVERHAPSFVDDFVTARRRATRTHAEDIDRSLIDALETLGVRLRSLLGEQSRLDADRVSDHAGFIGVRHGQPTDALA